MCDKVDESSLLMRVGSRSLEGDACREDDLLLSVLFHLQYEVREELYLSWGKFAGWDNANRTSYDQMVLEARDVERHPVVYRREDMVITEEGEVLFN